MPRSTNDADAGILVAGILYCLLYLCRNANSMHLLDGTDGEELIA